VSHTPMLVPTCLICIPEPSEYSPELVMMTGNQPLSAALHSGRRPDQVSNRHQIRSLAILFGLILIAWKVSLPSSAMHKVILKSAYFYVRVKNGLQFHRNTEAKTQLRSCLGGINPSLITYINKCLLFAELFKCNTGSNPNSST
jgi:hypothetical protein